MTRAQIRTVVIEELTRVAPEVDPGSLRPDSIFRQELDLDSMDVLNFVIALHGRLGIDVPERDYMKVGTLDSAVDYLASRLNM